MSVDLKSKLNALISIANKTIDSKRIENGTVPRHRVSAELFSELRAGGLAYIYSHLGEQHPIYSEFDQKVKQPDLRDAERALGILNALKMELE